MKNIPRISEKLADVKNSKQESFAYVAFGMAVLMFFAKITGLLKLVVLNSVYKIESQDLDIFKAANVIPELIFLIIAVGGINAALIPVLTQTSLDEDENRMKEVLSSIVNIFFLVLLGASIIIFIFAPQIIHGALGVKIINTDHPLTNEGIKQFTQLLRILIFSPIILCISSIFSSILQVRRKFFITQVAPLFYNFGIIFVAIFILPLVHKNVVYLAYGVILGSILHFLIQIPAILKTKIKYSPTIINLKDFYVLKAIKQTLPRTIGLTSDYIGNIFQTLIALQLRPGSLNAFTLALSLREIPVTMFGIATSQAVFPSLSEYAKKGEMDSFQKLFSKALRTILFWTLPLSTIMIVLRTPIIRLLFGLFTSDTLETFSIVSYILLFLSFGIIAYSVLHLVNRAFYSLDDSKTPTIVSICVIFIELGLTYVLVNLFSHVNNLSLNPLFLALNYKNLFNNGGSIAAVGGLGLSSSIAIIINVSVLILLLHRKGVNFFYEPDFIMNKVASALTMLVVGILSFKYLDIFFDLKTMGGLLIFSFNVFILMCISFYICEKFLDDDDLEILIKPLTKFRSTLKYINKLIKGRLFSAFTNS